MKVILAGYNLDQRIIASVRESLLESGTGTSENRSSSLQSIDPEALSPETLSAAYARISRDPKPIPELRAESVTNVAKARRSNETIVFGFGHASVAEHAVFNLDILDISRLALEALEASRLGSYTEKSQRYILLAEDYIVPKEISGSSLEGDFRKMIARQQAGYTATYQALEQYYQTEHADEWSTKGGRREMKNAAKEDARYYLGLATTGQVGVTMNARTLEGTIRRLAADPLAEARDLGERLHEICSKIAPSLIRYTDAAPYRCQTPIDLQKMLTQLRAGSPIDPASATTNPEGDSVRLISSTPDGEEEVLAAIIHGHSNLDWSEAKRLARELSEEQREALMRESLSRATVHDSLMRQFELAEFTFELIVSASCFAQLKRHRLATLLCQSYDPTLGVTVPPSFDLVGQSQDFRDCCNASAELYRKIDATTPAGATYALTNGHRRRVVFKANARELVHFSRLRLDSHAQWDIRALAEEMITQAKRAMPTVMMLAAGKDTFDGIHQPSSLVNQTT